MTTGSRVHGETNDAKFTTGSGEGGDTAPTTAPATIASAPSGAATFRPSITSRRRNLRRLLLSAGPAIVAVAGLVMWLQSGGVVSTEDAYVKAGKVTISPQVAGPIAAVAVRENQRVAAGDELFRLDDRPFRIALARAEAELAGVAAELAELKASVREKRAELELAHTNHAFAEREFRRQETLVLKKLSSQALLDAARYQWDRARENIHVTEQSLAQAQARLNGNPDLPLGEYPAQRMAEANRDAALLALDNTVVRAPQAGIASKVPLVGQFVAAGGAVMSVVAIDNPWIEANYMETDLTFIRPGQPAWIEIDAYPGQRWRGRVESISQATGAEFSVLPAQNASGNWVKITQRVPLRIAIEPVPGGPTLRVGMTATVAIDTGERGDGPHGSEPVSAVDDGRFSLRIDGGEPPTP